MVGSTHFANYILVYIAVYTDPKTAELRHVEHPAEAEAEARHSHA